MAKSAGSATMQKKSLRDYLTVVFRRVLLFLIPMVVMTTLVMVVILAMPKKYRGTAMASRIDHALQNTAIRGGNMADARASVAVIREEILAYPQLAEVVKREDVTKVLKINLSGMSEQDQQEALDRLRAKIDIRSVVKSAGAEIVYITVTDKDPERAKVLANAIGLNYEKYHRDVLEKEAKDATEFQQKQLDDTKKELEKVEKELERYRLDNFDNLPAAKLDILTRRGELDREIPLAQMRLTDATKALEAHQAKMKESPKRITQKVSPTESPEAVQLRARIADMENALTTLLITVRPNHPDVKLMQQEIANAKGRLKTLEKDTKPEEVQIENPAYQAMLDEQKRLETDVAAQKSALAFLETERNDLAKRIETFTPDAYRYNEMLRRQEEWTRKYENCRALLDESQISLRREIDSKGTTVTLFAPAMMPGKPSFPPAMYIVVALALALGATTGAGFVMLGEMSDSSFRTVEDAADYLDVPVLGTVGTIAPAVSKLRIWVKRVVLALVLIGMLTGTFCAYVYRDELRALVARFTE